MSNGLDTNRLTAVTRTNRVWLRRVAATGFVAGGGSLLGWSGIGFGSATADSSLAVALLLGAYVATLLGFGSLTVLARRVDDPTTTGVTPFAIGLVLLAPLLVGSVFELDPVPLTELFLAVTVVGVIAFVFGFAVLASTLWFRTEPTLLGQPWGRAAGVIATVGFLCWVVSMALGQPDPPQAFRVVSPYTTPLDTVTLIVVVIGFGALGVSLCLLGVALSRG